VYEDDEETGINGIKVTQTNQFMNQKKQWKHSGGMNYKNESASAFLRKQMLGEPKVMNFENAEGLDFEISDEELAQGIQLNKYPIISPLFASFNSLLYTEQIQNNFSPEN
jgi:hypothetical protein